MIADIFKNYKIEERQNASIYTKVGFFILAIVMSLIISFILIRYAGADVKDAAKSLFTGAFGGKRELIESLIKATPLILTGLATVVTFKARIWNIGQEGQLFAGAMMGYWIYLIADTQFVWLNIILAIIGGFIGGALCGWIPALLKVYFKVDEVLSTVIINYIMAYFLSFMLSATGPWRQADSFYQQTPLIADNAHWPLLFEGYRLHFGFVVALIAAFIMYLIMSKTPLGYEIRAFGSNPSAAEAQGISSSKLFMIIMIISGGLSGLAGAGELFGAELRLSSRISPGYGFTGIIIAMVAGLNPIGVIVAAILFGGLLNGAVRLQVVTGVPSALISVIQAMVLVFVLISRLLTSYRIRRIKNVA
jgi:simple sugar transport system permease protein